MRPIGALFHVVPLSIARQVICAFNLPDQDGQPWIDLNFSELAVGKAAGRASAAGRFAQRPGV